MNRAALHTPGETSAANAQWADNIAPGHGGGEER